MIPPEWSRERILQTSSGYWLSCALHTAVELKLFTALGEEAMHAGQLAQALHTDTDATERLLTALAAAGLLKNEGQMYRNTESSLTYLSHRSPDYLGDMLQYHHLLMHSWQKLSDSVRTGEPVRQRSSHADNRTRDLFLRAMADNAAALAPQIAAILPLQNHRRMLDLGGGSGAYALRFCQTNPELTGDIFDLPSSRLMAETTIREAGMEERLQFVGGDYLTDPLPGNYDLIWMSHILHAESRENARALTYKAAHALKPGGLLVIQEFVLDSQRCGPLFPALFSLNMLLGTPEGRAYCDIELTDMMAQAGLNDLQRLEIEATASALYLGHRPKI